MLVVRNPEWSGDVPAARTEFNKEVMACLKSAIKGSGWRKCDNRLYRQVGDWFAGAKFKMAADCQESGVDVEVKPMAFDDLMMEIAAVPEPRKMSLGLRLNAGARCAMPVMRSRWWSDAGLTPQANVGRLLQELSEVPLLIDGLKHKSYADFLSRHREPFDRFDYGPARIVSLICEGRTNEALAVAQVIVGNPRPRSTTIRFTGQDGRSRRFEECAVDWLKARLENPE